MPPSLSQVNNMNVQQIPSSQPLINIIIVDDERKACTNLKNLILEYIPDNITISGIANSTIEAEKLIKEHNPDVLFLDIEMPGETGMHFLDRIGPVQFEVVFVTAYDEYAIRAFKFNAVDYLLKPISIEELSATFQKLKDRLAYRDLVKNKQFSYTDIYNKSKTKGNFDKITLRGTNTTEIVDVRDIIYIEALSSYCKIYYNRNKIVKDITMSCPSSDFEDILPDDLFYRIHKSYLVNCSMVSKIINAEGNSIEIFNTFTLPISRRRYTTLLDFLRQNKYYNG